MKLVIRPSAAADIEHAYRWSEEQRRGLGLELLVVLRAAVRRILERPLAHAVAIRDTRRIRLKRFPYSVFYRTYADTVVIVACFHGKRDPKGWRKTDG